MKFIDLFSGIGGFRLGLEMAGHECVGHVEIDKFANQSYAAIHKPKESEVFYEDITRVTDGDIRGLRDLGIDIIAGGFPCQAFSIAGKRAGFEDTRGTLFFDIARIAREVKPKYLFLENVKGLLNHAKGDTFEVILRTLDELGYDAEWQVLNSKHFGVPQNRERVFIVGHSRGASTRKVFPITGQGGQVDDEFEINQIGNLIDTDSFGGNPQSVAIPVLTPDRLEKRQNGRRFKEDGEPMFTLTAQDRHGVAIKGNTTICINSKDENGIQPSLNDRVYSADGVMPTITTSPFFMGNVAVIEPKIIDDQGKIKDSYKIRKLTPLECWRLQGFPDWAFERAKAVGVSDSQLYQQAGNSVTVNVIYEIAKRLR